MMTLVRKVAPAIALMLLAACSALVAIRLTDFVDHFSPAILAVSAVGAVMVTALLLRPTLLMWIVTVLTLVVVGLVKFVLPGSGMLEWLAYGVAALLFVPAVGALLGGATPIRGENGVSFVVFMLLMFVGLGIVSWAITPPTPKVGAVAIKSWLLFGGVWAFFAFYPIAEDWVRRWLYGLLAIALLQWPLILYQFLVLRPWRISQGMIGHDVVVGTFGIDGAAAQGGRTAILAFFLVCAILVLLGMYRSGQLKRHHLYFWLALTGLPLLLLEVKAVFFYLPVGLLVLFADYIRSRPRTFFLWALMVAGLIYGGISLYSALHWGGSPGAAAHWFGYSFSTETSPKREESGHLTRAGAPLYWWSRHADDAGAVYILFGHGLGSSRTGGQAVGSMARQEYPWSIDQTALAALLWDIGVIGCLSWYGFLFAVFLMAAQVRKHRHLLEWQQGLARALQAIVPLFAFLTVYRNDIPYAGPMMFLFMAVLGLLFWLHAATIKATGEARVYTPNL